MIKFYYNTAPNPAKVALFLEESGLPYEVIPVDTRKGEQHAPAYLAINPNAKVPSIEDEGVVVFDSNAILLYLAEKSGKFLPQSTQARAQMYSWLMFIASGIGPYSGQLVHFRNFAPEPKALRQDVAEAHACPRCLSHGAVGPLHARYPRLNETTTVTRALQDSGDCHLGERAQFVDRQ